jgi:two-component system, sensor histidine kinase RegB
MTPPHNLASMIAGRPAGTAADGSLAGTGQRLVSVRWWSIGILVLLTLAAPDALGVTLPQQPMLAILAVVAGWNLLLSRQRPRADAAARRACFRQLFTDLVAFAALLHFSGGATNPLVFMLLLPVVMAALLLDRRAVIALAATAILLYSLLMLHFVPLPFADPARATALHLFGMWLTFVVSVTMLAGFVMRTSDALRRRDAELSRAREQTLRDERVLALGALAAGAAHELGTPLATLAVLAGELERESPAGSAMATDLGLMREQIAYCKRIITRLTERAGEQRSEEAESMRCDIWLQGLHDAWRSLRGDAASVLTLPAASAQPAPVIVVEPTLGQSIVSLLDNAQRAGAPIAVSLSWSPEALTVDIRDSGPGFPADVLRNAGRHPVTDNPHGHGIGLLLVKASLERMGGELRLDNPRDGGARARVTLPLDRIGVND